MEGFEIPHSNFGNPGYKPSFPSTQSVVQEKEFRKRFRDKSVIPMITNRKFDGKFKGNGTVLTVPILPLIKTQKTTPGGKVQYQEPKGTDEQFYLNRERYFGLKFLEEDQTFSAMDVEGPVRNEGAAQMSDDVEDEFFADIYTKVHVCNQGNDAGFRSQGFTLGSATQPITLYKTNAEASAGTAMAAPDYINGCISCLREMPGGKTADFWVIVPTIVANCIQTSELKQANMMGDSKSVLRNNVTMLGQIGGANIIVDDCLPMWKGSNKKEHKYNILFGDTSAITFCNEVQMTDEKMKDVNEFGTFYRTKMIYDWFVTYPERLGTGFVKIG